MKLTAEQIEVRRQLAERSGGKCEFPRCRGRAQHPHHRKMKKQGGSKTLDFLANFLHCCTWHHRWIHDHPALSYEHGYLVHSWDDPEKIPVLELATENV